jgi:hypothetical protein
MFYSIETPDESNIAIFSGRGNLSLAKEISAHLVLKKLIIH